MSSTNLHSLARDYVITEHRLEPGLEPGLKPGLEPDNECVENSSWQQEYKNSFTNAKQLCQALELNIGQLPISAAAEKQFQLRAPKSYVERMHKSDPNDPLLLQVLPTTYEDNSVDGYLKDPVGDLQSIKTPGLLQKYNGRALLLATSRCAVHCRYCFRRHFPYSTQNPRHDAWTQALQQLQQDQSITEIILSGGDPLVLDDAELMKLVAKLESIKHIKKLRIHTRLPVVIPNRICNALLSWIDNSRLNIIMVLHINHAQEINVPLKKKLQQLKNLNCTLLNQSVLLKNVNDSKSNLINLSEALFDAGVLPYYLHLLDKVEGAAHFDVSEKQAIKLMRQITMHLPGYLVPKLVKELAGEHSKTLINY